jgi:hypothetical protein
MREQVKAPEPVGKTWYNYTVSHLTAIFGSIQTWNILGAQKLSAEHGAH